MTGPILDGNECKLVQLPNGELVSVSGLSEAEAMLDLYELIHGRDSGAVSLPAQFAGEPIGAGPRWSNRGGS